MEEEPNPYYSPAQINYLYFGFLFFALSLLYGYHVFLVEKGSLLTQCFFLLYAIVQCFIEVLALAMVGSLVAAFLPKAITPVFMGMTFLLFLSHLIDFPLARLMGFSIWQWIQFVFMESFDNFVEMLKASNIAITTWLKGGAIAIFCVLCGIFFFKFTEKAADKKPFPFSYRTVITTLCCSLAFLFGWDISLAQFTPLKDYAGYQRAMPWKSTFFTPHPEILVVPYKLKKLKEEKSIEERIGSIGIKEHKPNIVIFVIESLREDFITAQAAPNLFQFKNDNIAFPLGLSSANATHLSWFSLFYSKFPFYWEKILPSQWTSGSIPLSILKKMGYKIQVYSSSRLSYYQMDELIFGKDRHLADSIYLSSTDEAQPVHERDAKAVAKLNEDLHTQKSGGVFIVFLDSTHFDYSWPGGDTVFKPIVEEIDYLKVAYAKDDLEGIKNRYRNAIHYIDTLVASAIDTMKEEGTYKESVMVIAGDHGEEFYEQGHLFHATTLSHVQTNIPLYYKFGSNNAFHQQAKKNKMTSHIDVFPSILHFLNGQELFTDLFDGDSIFSQNKWPYTISARYNVSKSPYEFFIHNGEYKLTASFKNENEIFNCQELHILSTKDLHDESINYTPASVKKTFGKALERLFSP